MATNRYRILVSDTPGGQREVRFQRLDEGAPRLDALYGSMSELADFEDGTEVSIDPEEHAKRVEEVRTKREEAQAARQAESLKSLGEAPDGSDGVAEKKSTGSPRPQPIQRTPPTVEPKKL